MENREPTMIDMTGEHARSILMHNQDYRLACPECGRGKPVRSFMVLDDGDPPTVPGKRMCRKCRKRATGYTLPQRYVQDATVYLITNPAFSGWVKIGKTKDAAKVLGRYNTHYPLRDCILRHTVPHKRSLDVEQMILRTLCEEGHEVKGEWARCTIKHAIEVINLIAEDLS